MDSNLSYFSLPCVDSKSQEVGYDEVLAQFLSGEEPLEEPDLNGPTTLHCEICKKQFDNAKKYYGHLRVHSKDCLWTCDKCPDLKFSTKQQLMKHSLTHKPLHRVWRCPQCSMAFESLWRLQQHLFSKHLEYRPHKCDQCEKSFHKLSDLNKHKSVHDGDRKHGCTQCEMKFKDKSNLKRHMLKHNGEKPYCCPGCGNRFQQLASLRRHTKKCMYAQVNSDNLESSIKKNHCKLCGMSFQYRNVLLEHCARVHANTPVDQKESKPDHEITVDTNRTEDNIVDDILSAEDDYMTLTTHNNLLNTYNPQNEASLNADNLMQIEFLKDMNQLHSLDDELFYNDIDFESFHASQVFNMNTNDMDYGANDRNPEILFDFAEPGRSLDQDLMNDLYHNRAEHLPDDLLNVPDVQGILVDKPNELEQNPTVSVNECSTIFESDVDLEASANLAANLNQLIGENNVQYISTEDDDTFIISLRSEIDAEQLTDMLNIGMEFTGNNNTVVDGHISDNTSDLENHDYAADNIEPIVVKIQQPKLCIDSGVIINDGGGKEREQKEKQVKIKVKKNVLFVCRKCNKVFNKKDNFKSHIATHEPSLRQHRCGVCGATFSYKSTLNKHRLKLHTPRVLPAHGCRLCGRVYSAKWLLKSHIERDHEGLAPYVCDRKDCGKKYFKKSDLDRHIRYHNGERPYSCDICKKKFQQISHMRRHEKSVDCVKRAAKHKL
ncbi:hypothetical protein ABMA27_008554 [Loxostege sticticalis]|uniref:C2H2-type domain-containing protein n=1 Tax=Loxostege sticticalis TaxID=481309 RepID=A0ABR3HBR8_LOXSC